jgi:hypothetical protein
MTSKYVLVPEQQFRKWQMSNKSLQQETDKSVSLTKKLPEKEDKTQIEKEPDPVVLKSSLPPPPGKPPTNKKKLDVTEVRVWKQW